MGFFSVGTIAIILGLFSIAFSLNFFNIKLLERYYQQIATNMNLKVVKGETSIMFLKLPEITGQWKDRSLSITNEINTKGKRSDWTTCIRLKSDNPTRHFQIYKAGMLSKVGRVFGVQDIIVGDTFFDEKFVIQANSESFAKTILNENLKHLMLLNHTKLKGTFYVEPRSIYYKESGQFRSRKKVDFAKEIIEILSALADSVEKT